MIGIILTNIHSTLPGWYTVHHANSFKFSVSWKDLTNKFIICQINAGKWCPDTILKWHMWAGLNVASLCFRILNHIDGPSGALHVFVQLIGIDKSEGSRFKLTTPYFVVVIILSGLRDVGKRRVLFVFVVSRLTPSSVIGRHKVWFTYISKAWDFSGRHSLKVPSGCFYIENQQK